MAKSKQTSKKAASSASKTLKDKSTGDDSKSGAGSALSQRKSPEKKTSESAAKSASKVLEDGRTSNNSKTAAGSALSQREGKSKTSTGVKKATSRAKKPKGVVGTNSTGAKKK